MNKNILALPLAVVFSLSVSAIAATDGTLGQASTGTTDVSLAIPDLIQVTGLSDLDLGMWDGVNDATTMDSICVYANNSSGQYSATFTGSGVGGAFSLADGAETVPYLVQYTDNALIPTVYPATSGTQIMNLVGAHQTLPDCGGVDNGAISVSIQQAVLATSTQGNYTGTLTMLIEPS